MVLVYALIALAAWPALALAALRVIRDGYADPDDLYVAVMMGGCGALFWPLILPAAVVLHVLRSAEVSK